MSLDNLSRVIDSIEPISYTQPIFLPNQIIIAIFTNNLTITW